MNSEGSLLGFSYDRWQIAPNRYATPLGGNYPWNPNNSIYVQPAYQAPQGTLSDANNFSPITNDANTQGQYLLATSAPLGITAGIITSIPQNFPFANPVVDTTNILLPTTATTIVQSAYIPLYAPNGRVAYLHMSYYGNGTAVTNIVEIGGIPLVSGVTNNTAGINLFPGYGAGLTQLVPSSGAVTSTLLYLEATATIANYPTGIQNLGTLVPGVSMSNVPLSAYGGTCMVPIIVYVSNNSATATLVQVGGLNLYTTYGPTTAPSGAVTSTTGFIQGSLLIGAESPQANIGFKERVTHFQSQSVYQYLTIGGVNSHRYSYHAQVPLKLLHDLFMQLDIPIINVGFNFQLFLAQAQGAFASAQYPPFMTSNNVNLQIGGLDDTPNPVITYGFFQGTGEPCRLYYRVVKFQPQDNSEMAKKLTAGFTKSFTFISTDWVLAQQGPIIPGTNTQQFYLSQSVVHPLRLWVLGYANNKSTGNTLPGSLIQSSSFAPGVTQGMFNQCNVQVNAIPYFRQNLQNQHDLWEQLREQFNPDTGSMISYQDFANYKRMMCFDLTRISDRLQSPTEPVSLIFQGNRADGLQCALDMFFLIERKNQVTFRFSAADVSIVVGNLD